MRWAMLILFLLVRPLWAASPAEICEQAALQVAAETGVPADILGALTLTETGRPLDGVLRPWPWAVNAEGAGSWFDDPLKAMAFAQARIGAGRPNVDIGCFQINYHWHGKKFTSLAEMFDPLANARYAAQFLRELHAESGDWRLAAGTFHSRRPEDASRYLARFDALRTRFQSQGFPGADRAFGPGDGHVELTARQFAMLTGAEIAGLHGPRRERVMLLGAPMGSRPDGAAGSLVVMGAGHGPLLGGGAGHVLVAIDGGGGGLLAP